MAGASITITENASEAVAKVVATAANPRGITAAIAGYLLFSTQRRFEREEDPDGKKWRKLSPRTAKARRGRGKTRGYDHILRDSTRLYQSLTTSSDETSATVGTNAEYAGIHQFGGEIKQGERAAKVSFKKIRGKRGVRFVRPGTKGAEERDVTIGARSIHIPARPYLGINDEDRREIQSVAADAWIEDAEL